MQLPTSNPGLLSPSPLLGPPALARGLSLPAASLPALPADNRRKPFDAKQMRERVYADVLQAAREIKPLSNARHTLKLTGVDYHGPDSYSLAEQKRAILEGRSLGRRLRGTWELYDNETGKLLEKKKTTLASVPFITPRGTIVNNGVQYTLSSQWRLQPGVFSRRKENGEIEAHINILPGDGVAHRYFLDPAKGVFYAKVGQAKIPLTPLLRALGATDKQLHEAWGSELAQANLKTDSPAVLRKYYERLLAAKDQEGDEPSKLEKLRTLFSTMRVDPGVMRKTLKLDTDRLSLDAILATTRKLRAISRGEADVDDRDNLAFQSLLGPEDLFSERLRKDYGRVQRDLFQKASWTGSLQRVGANALDGQLRSALLRSGLGLALEEINLAEVLDKQGRTSRLGEGGIPSTTAIPLESRSVQPSHLGFVDPTRTPESERAGVDMQLAAGVIKGSNGKVYAPFKDVRSGQVVYRSPQDVADLAIAFPGELEKSGSRAWAMKDGSLKWLKKQDIDLVVPDFEQAFSPLSNMIPFKRTAKAQRVSMGARMLTQALPLAAPEAPLVRNGVVGKPDSSYEQEYGEYMGAVRAKRPGRIMAVDKDSIRVRYADGSEESHELYDNFPLNRKTFIHSTPRVQPGDIVQPGQVLAKSNYTDDQGVAALGVNARTAYLPYKANFEDAVVISESMAGKLTSEHAYQHRLDYSDDMKLGKRAFLGLFPGEFSKSQMEAVDDHGYVKPGTIVRTGDPLILAARQMEASRNRIHKRGARQFNRAPVLWENSEPGVVTDVASGKAGVTVVVKSLRRMQVGDKMSGRVGDKGVVAAILPDNQMPQDREGRPFEVLLNPTGIVSRGNPEQYVEAVLGKIAAITGKPYQAPDFDDMPSVVEFAKRELKKHGVAAEEDVIDPETGRKLKDRHGRTPLSGMRFFMKLHHTAEDKGSGRGLGSYTAEETPAKGGEEGSKRISVLDTSALLSHGATGVLRDASIVRGQKNDAFWLALMQGHNPPAPSVPYTWRKFVSTLKASGINVVPDANGLHVMGMTGNDVKRLTGDRKIENGETLDTAKGMLPVPGGLFDPMLTGGNRGDRWAYIQLHQPLPNPVMEEPIRRLLGLTQKQLDDAIAGEPFQFRGASYSGPDGLAKALGGLDVKKELAIARAEVAGSKKTARDAAIRRLGYLKTAERLNMQPKDWLLDRVPVLPPMFRPISLMTDTGQPLVSDANYLYRELLRTNKTWQELSGQLDNTGDERRATYHAFKAVTGLMDPIHPKLQEKSVRGLLQGIFGSSPKYGTVQRRLLSTTVDLVGRAVISPNPDLDMDHVGLPEDRAWAVYSPFVVRRLVRSGMSMADAAASLRDRKPDAKDALLEEMSQRPVIINRAPVLHRFGIMSSWPVLTKETTMQLSPLIVSGFGADFDGDTMQYHVPVTEDARKEAIERMLPSKNLFSPADLKTPVHRPGKEYVGGIYQATLPPNDKQPLRRFLSSKDAVAAFLRGDIDVDTPIETELAD